MKKTFVKKYEKSSSSDSGSYSEDSEEKKEDAVQFKISESSSDEDTTVPVKFKVKMGPDTRFGRLQKKQSRNLKRQHVLTTIQEEVVPEIAPTQTEIGQEEFTERIQKIRKHVKEATEIHFEESQRDLKRMVIIDKKMEEYENNISPETLEIVPKEELGICDESKALKEQVRETTFNLAQEHQEKLAVLRSLDPTNLGTAEIQKFKEVFLEDKETYDFVDDPLEEESQYTENDPSESDHIS